MPWIGHDDDFINTEIVVLHSDTSVGEAAHVDALCLICHMGDGDVCGTLHIGKHAVEVGQSDEHAVAVHHAGQRNALALFIHHLNLLCLHAHRSANSEDDGKPNTQNYFLHHVIVLVLRLQR